MRMPRERGGRDRQKYYRSLKSGLPRGEMQSLEEIKTAVELEVFDLPAGLVESEVHKKKWARATNEGVFEVWRDK